MQIKFCPLGALVGDVKTGNGAEAILLLCLDVVFTGNWGHGNFGFYAAAFQSVQSPISRAGQASGVVGWRLPDLWTTAAVLCSGQASGGSLTSYRPGSGRRDAPWWASSEEFSFFVCFLAVFLWESFLKAQLDTCFLASNNFCFVLQQTLFFFIAVLGSWQNCGKVQIVPIYVPLPTTNAQSPLLSTSQCQSGMFSTINKPILTLLLSRAYSLH